MSPSNSPLVQWSSVLGRNSQSSDCWDYSLTCSEDDSGFADIRELHKQLDHSLLVSEKGTYTYLYNNKSIHLYICVC